MPFTKYEIELVRMKLSKLKSKSVVVIERSLRKKINRYRSDGLGNQNHPKNGFKTSWTRPFFIFCQNFSIFLSVFTLKKKAKNEEKPCSTCLLKNTLLHGTSKTRNPCFRYLIRH